MRTILCIIQYETNGKPTAVLAVRYKTLRNTDNDDEEEDEDDNDDED
jgi:hypothetical protein